MFEIEYFKHAERLKVYAMTKREDVAAGNSGDRDGLARDRRSELPATIASTVLMHGAREVTIVHAGEHYRLRITANNKLILTK
jgi:hemin uptake protein HemP